MAEYIDREAAIAYAPLPKHLREYQTMNLDDAWEDGYDFAIRQIESIPAADVRPVVLCRDCKWCHAGYCEKYDDLIPFGCANKPWEDWFCADGKR